MDGSSQKIFRNNSVDWDQFTNFIRLSDEKGDYAAVMFGWFQQPSAPALATNGFAGLFSCRCASFFSSRRRGSDRYHESRGTACIFHVEVVRAVLITLLSIHLK